MSDEVYEILHETLLIEAWQHAKVGAVVFDDDRTFATANQAYLNSSATRARRSATCRRARTCSLTKKGASAT